ncbi:MAG TPA: HEAT repeat domain-containing protein [Thermoanaerobaculia bacterium]|nr:HEAT repeat domain-containing protein [Thermoanaerobaculia bacterium]
MNTKMLAILLLATPLWAAPPRITGGSVQSLSSLSQAESIDNGWIGYSIATAKSFSSCGRCSLTSDNYYYSPESDDDLAPATTTAHVFARIRDKQVDRMRIFSGECEIAARGQTIYWIDSVRSSDSVAFLRRVADSGVHGARDMALFGISLHSGGTDTLIDIARNHPRSEVRGKALFWLSQAAGEKAAAALRDAVDNDPEAGVKSKAVFGISQLPNDQSIPILIDLLEHHRSREVRKKAAFWLGQKNDPRALEAIADILKE